MEKFLNLPLEKQNTIIDAALTSFGTNGYKKTSVSDIAAAAGISKAMVFHYFGTKSALYFYLIELCGRIIMKEVNEKFDNGITDFFERIMLSSRIEIDVMKKHPAIPSFLNSVYFENDGEVREGIQAIFANSEGENFRSRIAFEGVDASKFKDGVDPKLVMKMLTWMAYGYINRLSGTGNIDYEELLGEFEECVCLLRNNLYRQEYL